MALAESLKFEDVENDRLKVDLMFVREGEKPVISYFSDIRMRAEEIVEQVQLIHKEDPAALMANIHRYDEKTEKRKTK